MSNHPVWMNHNRKPRETLGPHPDECLTGWAFNNAGTYTSPKEGFEDNYAESDFRGHSLDAPGRLPAGGMESGSRRVVCPLQMHVYRERL